MALVSSNRRRLQRLAEQGSKGAKAALELLANPSKFLSSVQVGLTFGSIIAATFGGAPMAAALKPYLEESAWSWLQTNADVISRVGVSFVIGSLTIICAEIVPKRLGLSNPEGLAVILARPMQFISLLASPLVVTMGFCADIILRLFGRRRTPEDTMSEDELRMMADQGMATGVLQAFGLDKEQIAKAKTSWNPLLEAGKIDDEKRAEARRARQEKAAKEKAEKEKAAPAAK